MNNKAYNYLNYIPDQTTNYISMMNYKNEPGIMTLMNNNPMINDTQETTEPYLGFVRGNLFSKLYDPYRNYQPSEIKPTTDREKLLNQLQMYQFTLIELNLYLDVYPNDTEKVRLFNEYQKREKQLRNQYENTYGPLTINSKNLNNRNWTWIDSPWPWEGIK